MSPNKEEIRKCHVGLDTDSVNSDPNTGYRMYPRKEVAGLA
jgi:hypothetical protein